MRIRVQSLLFMTRHDCIVKIISPTCDTIAQGTVNSILATNSIINKIFNLYVAMIDNYKGAIIIHTTKGEY